MEKFCINPFVGLDIQPDGEIKPCCKINPTIPNDQIPNIKDGITKYKNNEWVKRLQAQFKNGERPADCSRCWKDESIGIKSKRQLDQDALSSRISQNDINSNKIKNIQISFGNICNLACRICGPRSSSRWVAEMKKNNIGEYPIHNWHQDQKVMDDIYEHTKDSIHMDFGGGEPLLTEITEHMAYLQRFVDNGTARDVTLHYVTNGTNFVSNQFLELWKKFKFIDIQVSIDDTGDRYEYNRYPAVWPEVFFNLKNYQNLVKENPARFRLSLSFTISAFTILYAEEFVIWCVRQGLPMPYMGVLSNPVYYRPSVFPKDIRKAIGEKLQSSKIKAVKDLKGLLDRDDSKHFDQFLEGIKVLDTIRKQDFAKIFPELHKLLP